MALAITAVLAGCGGGGGDAPVTTKHLSLTAADAQRMPIYSTGERHFVGVDQGGSADRLPEVGERGSITIRHGLLSDGVGREVLAAYMRQVGESSINRWPTAPEVRVIGGADRRSIDRFHAAVRLVNAALPDYAKMTVSEPLPGFSLRHLIDRDGTRYFTGEELANTIQIEFLPCSAFWGCGRFAGSTSSYNISNPGGHSYIQILTENRYSRGYRTSIILLAHELMHALGLYQHASTSFDTILGTTARIYATRQGIPQPRTLLYPVDREALRALFERLEPGDSPDDFGPWMSTSWNVAGEGPHNTFGVALRNGYAEPWAHGVRPTSSLVDNAALDGSATWTGTLLGLTPAAAAVAGDAEISVILDTLTGRADFTELETWGTNVAPGAAGTGTTWGDGDLSYTIAVRGNTFRETGGDDGRITGIFTGAAHEGATGTLERQDLTAAFGASR